MRPRWDILKHYTLEIGIYLCAFLFVYAAVSKLLDFDTFETQLGQSPLLSAYAKPVAIGVPVLELLISFFLMFKRFRRIALFGFFAMMVMFTTYIVIILNFTDFVPCSCGGVLEAMGWTEHLIFNCFFILLSGVSILVLSAKKNSVLLTLSLLTIFSVGVVSLIFLSSEKEMKRNNAFQRRYVPHPLEKIGSYNLRFNSYYIAGISEDHIYLGNVTTPLQIMSIETSLKNPITYKVSIDNRDLPFKRIKIQVLPPYFYLADGTIPILFKGAVSDWKAQIFSHNDGYFTQFAVMDSTHLGISTLSALSNTNALGIIERNQKTVNVKLNHNILEKQMDGQFDTGGMLLYNQKYRQFIYAYFYRNAFEVTNTLMDPLYTGTTIDTISKAIVDVAYYSKDNAYKLGPNSVLVNKNSATYGDYLYIHSDRLGRYENDAILESAGIIDVYSIKERNYVFSFYLYHQMNRKIGQFMIYKDILVAIVDDQLWLYRLNKNFFKELP